ncbi:hypothetical protein MXL46_11210 [Heyndrickxia sporothermodurans]|uniref:hypothetical protein n=1 Tax=Heyndrickxia sporothermodurans TaxID=46224 RepID=UPI002DBA440B|nr:hypothetical protein [Heyndrickxia sporothermodurans]MEB6549654.1 hypothetical protein [Heyndrickxia sporothermodurans]
MKRILRRAAETKSPIQIIYIDNDNNLTQRTIKVLAVTDKSIKAYCFTKRQFRTFKLQNILSTGKIAI